MGNKRTTIRPYSRKKKCIRTRKEVASVLGRKVKKVVDFASSKNDEESTTVVVVGECNADILSDGGVADGFSVDRFTAAKDSLSREPLTSDFSSIGCDIAAGLPVGEKTHPDGEPMLLVGEVIQYNGEIAHLDDEAIHHEKSDICDRSSSRASDVFPNVFSSVEIATVRYIETAQKLPEESAAFTAQQLHPHRTDGSFGEDEHADAIFEDVHRVRDITDNIMVERTFSDFPESGLGTDDDSLSIAGTVAGVTIDGRRIVNLNYFLQRLDEECHKHNIVCKYPLNECALHKYVDRGLRTQLFFKCQRCGYSYNIWTDPDNDTKMGINESAVCGTFTSGTGYYTLQEQLAAMDIPSMSHVTFGKYRDLLFHHFQSVCEVEMKKAAEKERKIAIYKGNMINQIPYITVVADGCWAKRSYAGGKHDSLSGAAMIIGAETNLVLYVGVRNKYCAIHAEAQRLSREPPEHVCYKNWGLDQSSTAMETDILCQGFKESLQTHGLIYKTLISDGDSSSLQAIRDANPYAELGVIVTKIECSNHLFRNLCKKLREASKMKLRSATLREDDLSIGRLREHVRSSGFQIRISVELARDERNKEKVAKSEKSTMLQKDILIIFKHAFGDHSSCGTLPILCSPKTNEKNLIQQLEDTGIYSSAYEAVRYLSCHADSLLEGVTNNIAESGNSIVNKLNNGKRVNYCAKNSYEMRCYAAVVQHNTQELLSKVIGGKRKEIPVAVLKMERTRQLHVSNNKLSRNERKRHKPRRYHATDKDYGPTAKKPDLPKDVYDTLVQDHFEKLKRYQDNLKQIERDTIAQSDSELWLHLRTIIVTASKFGKICKMKKSTSCSGMVASICYPKVLDTAAVLFGTANEQTAKDTLEIKLGKTILPCGLFIDPDIPYLGATPDGLIDSDGIVEVKCPFSAKDVTLEDAIKRNPNVRSIFDKNNPDVMNKNHIYYYQVQGQLHITRRTYCIFALWTLVDLKYIKVRRDDEFWRLKMEPLLSRFYNECLLPEIVDSRRHRSMPIRDPDYIQTAKEEMEQKKAQNLEKKRKRDQLCAVTEKGAHINEKDDSYSSDENDKLPLIVSKSIRSGVSKKKRVNRPWQHVEMDDETEIAEEDRNVLETLRENISVNDVITDIQSQTSLLNDTSIDFFQNIVERNSNFRFNPASYTAYYRYINPCASQRDMQIIGGNSSEHWCCVYYDGTQLMVYDSLNPSEYCLLHRETKRYIQKRYPSLKEHDVILQPVTRQPDAYSCGVYAIAFATTVALGGDPSHKVYSSDALKMRAHLASIVRDGTLSPFPTK